MKPQSYRHYDPRIGRFISEDPIGFNGDGTNLYDYVLNNPINFIDREGKKASDTTRRILAPILLYPGYKTPFTPYYPEYPRRSPDDPVT